jgi:hypothetical protein
MYLFFIIASEELNIGNVKFTTHDLGGHRQGNFILFCLFKDFVVQLVDCGEIISLKSME